MFCLLLSIQPRSVLSLFLFFNDTATTEIYTLSLHDALPIYALVQLEVATDADDARQRLGAIADQRRSDRKSTRLNSSHGSISYAVFCLKKKKKKKKRMIKKKYR